MFDLMRIERKMYKRWKLMRIYRESDQEKRLRLYARRDARDDAKY